MTDLNCSEKTRQDCERLMQQMSLPASFTSVINDIYLPLSTILINKLSHQPLLVSINGAQGTGKSTLSVFIKKIIESEMKCQVAALSLDDFYYTRQQRLDLAERVHPLLVTRGVPGTHDADLIEIVLESLMNAKACTIPRFNKATDDRYEEQAWQIRNEPVDVILFEGWCNNSPAQSDQELQQPINELEAIEDAQGLWRQYANDHLKEYHRRFFQFADVCVMLQAPDFERIYQWRHLQEQKLKASTPAHQQHRILSDAELRRFLQHYERISRHTLSHLPDMADVLLPIASDHSITGIKTRS